MREVENKITVAIHNITQSISIIFLYENRFKVLRNVWVVTSRFGTQHAFSYWCHDIDVTYQCVIWSMGRIYSMYSGHRQQMQCAASSQIQYVLELKRPKQTNCWTRNTHLFHFLQINSHCRRYRSPIIIIGGSEVTKNALLRRSSSVFLLLSCLGAENLCRRNNNNGGKKLTQSLLPIPFVRSVPFFVLLFCANGKWL